MTFNPNRICEIVKEVSGQFRKTAEMITSEEHAGLTVQHVYMMPHTSEAPEGLEMVDVWFIKVGVKKAAAEAKRAELVALLDEWPTKHPLSGGLSYITIGGELGSQDLALMLLAVGKVLGFWKIMSPAIVGMKPGDPTADEMAGMGFVMASGYRPEGEQDAQSIDGQKAS